MNDEDPIHLEMIDDETNEPTDEESGNHHELLSFIAVVCQPTLH